MVYIMHQIPPAVRILPMDSKETPGFVDCPIEDIQRQFFLGELARPGGLAGRYQYHNSGLRAEPGTVVLFQFRGKIIASAVLAKIERIDAARGIRGGAMQFDAASIKVFDPVDASVLGKVWPQVTRLGQAKWALDPKGFTKFERLLTGVEFAQI